MSSKTDRLPWFFFSLSCTGLSAELMESWLISRGKRKKKIYIYTHISIYKKKIYIYIHVYSLWSKHCTSLRTTINVVSRSKRKIDMRIERGDTRHATGAGRELSSRFLFSIYRLEWSFHTYQSCTHSRNRRVIAKLAYAAAYVDDARFAEYV